VKAVPWDSEVHAMEVITLFLGGQSIPLDPGGGAQQLHDFDQHLESGIVIAVEVTRANNSADLQFVQEVSKVDWESDALSQTWIVDVRGIPNVRVLRDKVIPLLAAFEAADITSVHLRHEMFDIAAPGAADSAQELQILDRSGTLAAGEELCRIGVCLVYSLGPASPGRVEVGYGSVVSSTAPSLVADVALDHAHRRDNAVKLAAADDRAERHLFVWVEASLHSEVAAFAFDDGLGVAALPTEPLDIPDCIDAVWLATAFDPSRVWRYHREHGWESLGSFKRASHEP
jgi:hypothetical protein